MNAGDIKEELDRCQNDPHYFYTIYCLIDGKKPTTLLSKEEFNYVFNNSSVVKTRKGNALLIDKKYLPKTVSIKNLLNGA